MIELLAAGQPVYYAGVHEPGYQRGLEEAQTWADYLSLDLEHHPFAPEALHQFMRGLSRGHSRAVMRNDLISVRMLDVHRGREGP